MIKQLVLILFFLTIGHIAAQKKEAYFNDDLKEISITEFESEKDAKKFYNLRIESDSLIAHVKVQRIKKGQLSPVVLDSIRSELSRLSNELVSEQNTIIVNYYHGVDKCNSTQNASYVRSKYKRYLKKLRNLDGVSQFFMFKSPEGTTQYGKQLNWIEDKNGTFESLFLLLPYPCGSLILIEKTGHYYIQKGEYDIESIIELVKNLD